MTTGEVLKAARALVEKGWRQGSYWNAARTCFCPMGAIRLVSSPIPPDDRDCLVPEEAAALREFSEAIPGHDMAAWNDAPDRTQAEVLAAFDKAIAEVGP